MGCGRWRTCGRLGADEPRSSLVVTPQRRKSALLPDDSRTSQNRRQSRNAAARQRPATPQRHSAVRREACFGRPPFSCAALFHAFRLGVPVNTFHGWFLEELAAASAMRGAGGGAVGPRVALRCRSASTVPVPWTSRSASSLVGVTAVVDIAARRRHGMLRCRGLPPCFVRSRKVLRTCIPWELAGDISPLKKRVISTN